LEALRLRLSDLCRKCEIKRLESMILCEVSSKSRAGASGLQRPGHVMGPIKTPCRMATSRAELLGLRASPVIPQITLGLCNSINLPAKRGGRLGLCRVYKSSRAQDSGLKWLLSLSFLPSRSSRGQHHHLAAQLCVAGAAALEQGMVAALCVDEDADLLFWEGGFIENGGHFPPPLQ